MRDRMERFILLPFTAGCMSESSIAIGMQQQQQQHAKRSKLDIISTPTRSHKGRDEEEDEEEYLDDEESLSGQNLRSPLYLLAVPRLQKLFRNVKNFPQLFVYKEDLESEMGMEIGSPTDIKHVTHIGLDGCTSSILSNNWANHAEQGFINLPSFPLTPLAFELAMEKRAETPDVRNSLETKSRNSHDAINSGH